MKRKEKVPTVNRTFGKDQNKRSHKAYDTLDPGCCLDILATYGMVTRAIYLLWRYWEQLTVVAWSRGYYCPHYKGFRGVTQWNMLSPTIFNVVVDAFLWHWVNVAAATEKAVTSGAEYTERFGRNVQHLLAYFYTDNGILAMNRANHLQQEFDNLMELFDRVGLHTNVDKIVSMYCQPCCALEPLCRGLRPTDDG